MYLKKDDLSDFCIISKMKNIWSNKKKYKICYFNEKISFFDDFFSYSWHKNCLCHGIKYPIFPPSKMPINYLYARNIKEFLLFMPGIYTKDLGYLINFKI